MVSNNVFVARSKVCEFNGFFQDVKILSKSPPGGTLSWGSESEISGSLNNLKPEKIGRRNVCLRTSGHANLLLSVLRDHYLRSVIWWLFINSWKSINKFICRHFLYYNKVITIQLFIFTSHSIKYSKSTVIKSNPKNPLRRLYNAMEPKSLIVCCLMITETNYNLLLLLIIIIIILIVVHRINGKATTAPKPIILVFIYVYTSVAAEKPRPRHQSRKRNQV